MHVGLVQVFHSFGNVSHKGEFEGAVQLHLVIHQQILFVKFSDDFQTND
jgi:hypothetical protein